MDKGPVHFAGCVGSTVIEIYPLRGESTPVDTSTRLGFAVENLTDILHTLQETGAPVVIDTNATTKHSHAVVRDPDGRAVELTSK